VKRVHGEFGVSGRAFRNRRSWRRGLSETDTELKYIGDNLKDSSKSIHINSPNFF
jgi:hypothetical protein